MIRRIFTMPYYAVARGRTTGVFVSWDVCRLQVDGFSKPIYKKFNTYNEAASFVASHGAALLRTSSINLVDSVDSKQTMSTSAADCNNSNEKPTVRVINNNSTFTLNNNSSTKRIKKINDISNDSVSNPLKRSATNNSCDVSGDVSAISGSMDDLNSKRTKEKKEEPDAKIVRLKNYGKYVFTEDNDNYVHVYTDGSCLKNGMQDKAAAGIGVYFGEGHVLNTALPVTGLSTNNVGEIQAAAEAIRLAKENGIPKLCINTDSKFLINSMTVWMPDWLKRNWTTSRGAPVINKNDFVKLNTLLADKQITIKWNYVKAHKGILGNERADELAKEGAALHHNRFSLE